MLFKISYYLPLIILTQSVFSHELNHEIVVNVISRLFTELYESVGYQRVAILYDDKQKELIEKLIGRRFAEGVDLTLMTDLQKLSQTEFTMIAVFASNNNLVSIS